MKSRKEIHYSAISLITLLERNKINFEQMPEILDRAKVLLQRNERKKIKTEVCHLQYLSLIHISEPTRRHHVSRMPSSA